MRPKVPEVSEKKWAPSSPGVGAGFDSEPGQNCTKLDCCSSYVY